MKAVKMVGWKMVGCWCGLFAAGLASAGEVTTESNTTVVVTPTGVISDTVVRTTIKAEISGAQRAAGPVNTNAAAPGWVADPTLGGTVKGVTGTGRAMVAGPSASMQRARHDAMIKFAQAFPGVNGPQVRERWISPAGDVYLWLTISETPAETPK